MRVRARNRFLARTPHTNAQRIARMTCGIFPNIVESVLIRLESPIWTAYLPLCFCPTCAAQKCDRGRDGVYQIIRVCTHRKRASRSSCRLWVIYRWQGRPPGASPLQCPYSDGAWQVRAACMCWGMDVCACAFSFYMWTHTHTHRDAMSDRRQLYNAKNWIVSSETHNTKNKSCCWHFYWAKISCILKRMVEWISIWWPTPGSMTWVLYKKGSQHGGALS